MNLLSQIRHRDGAGLLPAAGAPPARPGAIGHRTVVKLPTTIFARLTSKLLNALPRARLQPGTRHVVATLNRPQMNRLLRSLPPAVRATDGVVDYRGASTEALARIEHHFDQRMFAPKLHQAPLPDLVKRQYEYFNLKVTSRTAPLRFNAQTQLSDLKKLGAGAFNSTYGVSYRDTRGRTYDAVFKPLSSGLGGAGEATEIPGDDPQLALRNLATCDLAAKLKFDVIPDTEVGTARWPMSHGRTAGRVGLIMEKAPGEQGSRTDKANFRHPQVMRELTKLQLLDHLTGQGDRHNENYFISVEGDKARVSGIDNDQCFGRALKDPDGVMDDYTKQSRFRGTRMPPMIDTEMAKAINDLTDRDLDETLGDKLRPDEVKATKERLKAMKTHIEKLDKEGCVIDPQDWGHWQIRKDFDRLADRTNSYVARDRNPPDYGALPSRALQI